MKLTNIRCDFRGCNNLTNKICKLEDLPEKVQGEVSPSYPVYVKICNAHNLKVIVEQLEFIIDWPDHWKGWAPYQYKCVRCKNIWNSHFMYINNNNYGKIPSTCPSCHKPRWFKEARLKRKPTKGSDQWKETKVYHKVVAS